MSSESRASAKSDVVGECTSCEASLDEQRLALQTYSGDDRELSGLSAGGLLSCPDCAEQPVELLGSWVEQEQPPIVADRSISTSYRESADNCSFCTEELGESPVLGVELYRRPGDALPAYANYTLCSDCRNVFEEFLANISARGPDC